MPLSEKCRLLIEKGYVYNVSHGNNLTNHLPMALIALDKINASEEDLQNFSDGYNKRLELLSSDSSLKKITSIEDHLGDQSHFLSYFNFFKGEILAKGTSQVLTESIPILIESPSSCAFHCLIRTSYAVSSGLTHEFSMALAYWASEFKSFKTKIKSRKSQQEEVTEELRNLSLKFKDFHFNQGNISTRMTEVDNLLSEVERHIIYPKYSLSSIAETALSLYAQTENFTLLHGVTGSHAFRTLLPYIDDKEMALQYLWQGIVLAFLSTGLDLPSSSVVYKNTKFKWEDIFNKAVKSTDAHTIKLVYTSWQEWREYNNPLYIYIANKKVDKS